MTTESTSGTGRDSTQEQVEVRSGTVLRARRQDIELHTADGLTLVGELALPPDRDPVATLVTLHPLPTHGGFMDSHVFKKASNRLPALGRMLQMNDDEKRAYEAQLAEKAKPVFRVRIYNR